MAFRKGDPVQATRNVKSTSGLNTVGKGTQGKVVEVNALWDKILVDFKGTKCRVTSKDIKRKSWW
jgi:ribosomal protein L24